MKTAIEEIKAIYVVTEDANNDVLFRLCYPTISQENRSFICKKRVGGIYGTKSNSVYYYHYKKSWFYFGPSFMDPLAVEGSDVRSSIVIESSEFNPEKFEALLDGMHQVYKRTPTIKSLLSSFLAILVDNQLDLGDTVVLSLRDFEQKRVMAAKSPLKPIINMFGLDTIIIYTALILKRRICVYHHKPESLLQFIRALPSFVWHRQNWSEILYPHMDLQSKHDISQLENLTHYIAGFTSINIESKLDLFDVFVNLPALEVTVANHAKEIFSMTKTHKEIALFMKRLAENEDISDTQVIQQISAKTLELLETIKVLMENPPGEEESENRKLAPALESFLKNLSVAEKI